MPPTYEQNKIHIYKWRQSNLQRTREINKLSKRKYDTWKKISKVFLNILL